MATVTAKWKYMSMSLSLLVAALVLAPQADAANPDHNTIMAAIASAVTTIQSSIATSAGQTETNLGNAITASEGNVQDAITDSAAQTQENVGTVHAISLDNISLDPTPGVSTSLDVFGGSGGPSQSGQFTFDIRGPLGADANKFTITCDTGSSGGAEFVFTEEGSYTQDFTCTLFTIIVYDNGSGGGVGPVTVNGLLQYTTAEDVTTISGSFS